jgi:hypothetical protein
VVGLRQGCRPPPLARCQRRPHMRAHVCAVRARRRREMWNGRRARSLLLVHEPGQTGWFYCSSAQWVHAVAPNAERDSDTDLTPDSKLPRDPTATYRCYAGPRLNLSLFCTSHSPSIFFSSKIVSVKTRLVPLGYSQPILYP